MHAPKTTLGYKVLWGALLLLHTTNIAYYVGAAVLYTQIRKTNLDFQLSTYSIGISHDEWAKVSVVHLAVAACHGLNVLAMVGGSAHSRRLVFEPDIPQLYQPLYRRLRGWCGSATVSPDTSSAASSHGRFRSLSSFPRTAVGTFVTHGRAVFGQDGVLGVESPHFDSVHLVREVVETSLQTAQAYRMTTLLPRVWFIRFYVALLVANCWSTPFVYRYYRHCHRHRRLTSLLCDAILDVVSSIGVSLWLFASYAPQYTDPAFGFQFEKWFDDVWFTNMQQEFQMMMVTSWADLTVRLVFAFGLLQSMGSIKKLLAHRAAEACSIATIGAVPDISSSQVDNVMRGATNKDEKMPSRTAGPRASTRTWRVRLANAVHTAGPMCFMMWGLTIFVVHLVSETRDSDTHIPCELKLRPWLTRKPACSLVVLDCYALGQLPGSIPSMASAWTAFNADTTARVVVRHCPRLAVPTSLQEFHRLSTLKVYNSTIASWPTDSAFTETDHPGLKAIFLIRTDLTNGILPLGMLSAQFPSSLIIAVISRSNLSVLPPNLHHVWPQALTLVFEMTAINTIQDTLYNLNPKFLSLAGSPVTAVPPEIFEIPVLQCIFLGYTSIQELPRVVVRPTNSLYLLLLQGTNISTFWSWMDPFVEGMLYWPFGFFNAFDTPYCARLAKIESGNDSSEANATDPGLAKIMDMATPAKLQFARRVAACIPGIPFYFPLAFEDSISAVKGVGQSGSTLPTN